MTPPSLTSRSLTPRRILWGGVAASAVLTFLVWLGGFGVADQYLLPDQGASWYRWKLPDPTVWTRLSAWSGYVAHQLVAWGLIFYAQTLFGFLAVFVITQMHGVGWSRRTRTVIAAGYVLAVVASYAWLGFGRVNEIVRIPIIEDALVAVLSLLIWGGLAIARAVHRPRTPDPADEESVSA